MNFPEGMREHLMSKQVWRLVRTAEHFTFTVALGDLGVPQWEEDRPDSAFESGCVHSIL